MIPKQVFFAFTRQRPHHPLTPQTISPLAAGQQDRGRFLYCHAARVNAGKFFLFSDLWRLQCCGVVVGHQPCLVNVAHFSADFAHQTPATILHVTVSLHRGAALEVCLDPINAILGAWLVVHETCVMDLSARVCRQLLFAQESTLTEKAWFENFQGDFRRSGYYECDLNVVINCFAVMGRLVTAHS